MSTKHDDVYVLPIQNGKHSISGAEDDPDTKCGVGGFKPRFLQVFACIGSFIGIYSASGLLTSTLAVYINSQVSMLEKQFGFSSSETGFLMACNDIGFLAFILFTGYLAKRVHIPRGLAVSTILFGICGILCALPHFLQDKSAFVLDDRIAVGQSNISRSIPMGKKVPLCDLSNTTRQSMDACSDDSKEGMYNLEQLWIKKMAFALLGIGMVFQGIGKAPRSPFITLYIDDAVSKKKTGFYMGIIIGTGIFGPALAYLVGGLFSKLYVTLESVNISPKDPRWIGAWWLGFLVFGACSICFSIPLMCFPRKLRSSKRLKEEKIMEKNRDQKPIKKRTTSGLISHEFKEYTKSIMRCFKSPAYTLLATSSLINILGVAGSISFLPKYLAGQYTVPLWKANIIMAFCSIMSVSLGSFIGGVITRRLNMTPLVTCKLMIFFYSVHIASQVAGYFLGCEQPEVFGDNKLRAPSELYKLTDTACNSDCSCDESRYFPICGDDGRSYFSPCHAGCLESTLRDFSNCTCIPTGHATAGLCDQGCTTKLYVYAVITFIGKLFTAFKIIPTFIGLIRSVEERDRAAGQACKGFLMSALGWMPGPVIFGAIIDRTCSLWRYTCGERQSCSVYNIEYFRLLLHSFSVGTSGSAALLMVILYGYFKFSGKNQWKGDEDRMKAMQSKKDEQEVAINTVT